MFDPDRRHLIAYVAAAAVLVVIAVRWLGRDGGSDPIPSISMPAPASANPGGARARALRVAARPAPPALIWVDVAGAVRRPGLYSLPKGARVAMALDRAGGVRRRADRAAVNLAARVADGQQIYVPIRGGRADPGPAAASAGSMSGAAGAPAGGALGTASAGGALGAASAGGAVAGAQGGAPIPGARISLSNATQAELETLDGIGPALAQRIIQFRQQHGGFRSIDELKEVSGIGDKRFAALKPSISP